MNWRTRPRTIIALAAVFMLAMLLVAIARIQSYRQQKRDIEIILETAKFQDRLGEQRANLHARTEAFKEKMRQEAERISREGNR